jgi:hypothetical protein
MPGGESPLMAEYAKVQEFSTAAEPFVLHIDLQRGPHGLP